MTIHKTLPKKTYELLASMIALGSLGDVLLSKGMKHVGEVQLASLPEMWGTFVQTFSSGRRGSNCCALPASSPACFSRRRMYQSRGVRGAMGTSRPPRTDLKCSPRQPIRLEK
jgi:hypothetical protein